MKPKEVTCPRLADALVELGCPADAINEAAAEFYRERRFGEWLVERGIVTQGQLSLALARQAMSRGDFAAADSLATEAARTIHANLLGLVDAFRVASVELSSVEIP
jgi:hypothetical protein